MATAANPFLTRLGFAAGDRVAILHADDVGMCPATLPAFAELIAEGALSSGSLMVPCPAFPQAAVFARSHPSHPQVDLGVHLTLNSEWATYRWGPLSPAGASSGLRDAEGFFPREREAVGEADPKAVAAELAAQLDAALAAGFDITHLDAHMFAALQPRLLPTYLALARERRLPALVWRPGPALPALSKGDANAAAVAAWAAEGFPVADHVAYLPLGASAAWTSDDPSDWRQSRWEEAKAIFDAFPPGLTHFLIHPACDDPELRALARDWRARIADYELFRSGRPREYLRAVGVEVIGYREVRAGLGKRDG
jgi:chitin disaccharide deacetylase